MKPVNFEFGRERKDLKFQKCYFPYIQRFGKRCFAWRGKIFFRTATQAQEYARRWVERADRYFQQEAAHVDTN